MVSDGVAVDLLLDLGQQHKCRADGTRRDFALFAHQAARAVPVVLDHAEDGNVYLKLIENFPDGRELPLAAVEQQQVRQRLKAGLALLEAPHAAPHHLAHGFVVVLPLHGLDFVSLVVLLGGPPVHEDHDAAHHLAAARVGDVHRLDAARRLCQPGQRAQLGHAPAHLFLAVGQPGQALLRVALGKLQHAARLAALRHPQMHPAPRPAREILLEQVRFIWQHREQNLARDVGALQVVLLDKGRHAGLRRLELGPLKEEAVCQGQPPVSDGEHHHGGVLVVKAQADDIALHIWRIHHLLALLELLQRLQTVAQPRRLLKAQLLGSLLHTL